MHYVVIKLLTQKREEVHCDSSYIFASLFWEKALFRALKFDFW